MTCRMLSSATDATTHSPLGFQLKSLTLEVCPPWMKSNSGGPSSASLGSCRIRVRVRVRVRVRIGVRVRRRSDPAPC